MKLQDWWDCEDWGDMPANRWRSTSDLDWQNQTIYDWLHQSRETWGGKQAPALQPAFPSVSLESLGFSQDADYVYIPYQSISAPGWQNLSIEAWINMADWSFALTKEKLLFLLLLKLQSANLPAHQVTGVGFIGQDHAFILESRAEVINA